MYLPSLIDFSGGKYSVFNSFSYGSGVTKMWVLFYSSYRYFGLCCLVVAEVSLAKLPSFDRHHENPAKILQIFLRPSRWGRRFFTSFPLQKRRVFGGLFASFYIACHWTLLGYYQKWTKRHNGALLAALQSQTLGFCIDMKKSRLSISDISKVPNTRTHTILYSPKQ